MPPADLVERLDACAAEVSAFGAGDPDAHAEEVNCAEVSALCYEAAHEVARLRAIEAAARAYVAAVDAWQEAVDGDGPTRAQVGAMDRAGATLTGLLAGEVTDAGKAAGS